MRKKAFASDFDGTLYFMRGEEHYRPEDLEAIRQFQMAGNLFGVCTGRSLKGISLTTEGIVDFDFYILATGALVLDKDMQTIFKKTISRELLTQVYEEYSGRGDNIIQANDTVYSLGVARRMQTQVSSIDEIPGDDIYGFSVLLGSAEEAREVAHEICTRYDQQLMAYPNTSIVDVIPYGCSKGHAIDIIKEHYGVKEMAGIGDSFNDVPMLEAADQAFTFHASPESVQAHADHVVDTVAEAVALFLEPA